VGLGVHGLEFMVYSIRAQVLGFRGQGSEFSVQCSMFSV
jgi:hypothetical protein